MEVRKPGPGTKGGRPQKRFTADDWKTFEKLGEMGCTVEELAAFFEISDRHLAKLCKERYGETTKDVLENFFYPRMNINLRRSLMQLAKKNGSVAIFLGKNVLGMHDQSEIEMKTSIENLQMLADMLVINEEDGGDGS